MNNFLGFSADVLASVLANNGVDIDAIVAEYKTAEREYCEFAGAVQCFTKHPEFYVDEIEEKDDKPEPRQHTNSRAHHQHVRSGRPNDRSDKTKNFRHADVQRKHARSCADERHAPVADNGVEPPVAVFYPRIESIEIMWENRHNKDSHIAYEGELQSSYTYVMASVYSHMNYGPKNNVNVHAGIRAQIMRLRREGRDVEASGLIRLLAKRAENNYVEKYLDELLPF